MKGMLLPGLVGLLLLYALFRRVNVLDAFTEGARKGLRLMGRILPSMAAMLMLVNLLEDTGLLSALCGVLSPLCMYLGLDSRLVPVLLLRPLSGSGATSLVAELYAQAGPDSPLGIQAGSLHGAMETVFYTLAVYFGSVHIRRTRYAGPLSLLVTLIGGLAALVIARVLYP